MRIFKTKWLARFARHEGIADASLREAIDRAERGLIDADLGGGLIKQRVARQGKGRSGGYRMVIAYRAEGRAVFLSAFAKKQRENIEPEELVELREVGLNWLNASVQKIALAIEDGALQEVDLDEQKDT
jgi:hypothetical protein